MLDEYGCRKDGLIDDTSYVAQTALLNLQEVEKAYPELATSNYWTMALVMLNTVIRRLESGTA